MPADCGIGSRDQRRCFQRDYNYVCNDRLDDGSAVEFAGSVWNEHWLRHFNYA